MPGHPGGFSAPKYMGSFCCIPRVHSRGNWTGSGGARNQTRLSNLECKHPKWRLDHWPKCLPLPLLKLTLKKSFILFERQITQRGEREKDLYAAVPGLGQTVPRSEELRLGLPCGWQEMEHLGHLPVFSPGGKKGAGLEQPGPGLVTIWRAGVAGGHFIQCATTVASFIYFFLLLRRTNIVESLIDHFFSCWIACWSFFCA